MTMRTKVTGLAVKQRRQASLPSLWPHPPSTMTRPRWGHPQICGFWPVLEEPGPPQGHSSSPCKHHGVLVTCSNVLSPTGHR